MVLAYAAGYHALDSWYLQTANASRLRAEYGAIAAARFSQYAEAALRREIATTHGVPYNPERYAPLFAALFANQRLLPAGVPNAQKNTDALTLHVTTPDGRTVFRSGTPQPLDHISREVLPADVGGLTVAVSARKSAVAWLATEHLASRMAVILWTIVLSSILSIVAVRLMGREAKLVRARTDFVSSVSHELRTPLAQIQIFLETLRLGRYNTDGQREWIFNGMQREITRLTTLVNNVLQFSRAENGYSLPERRRIDLAEYLGEIVHGFEPLAATRFTRIETAFEEDLAAMIAPDAFRQVILNLLDNAVKYGPEGQTVRVVTQRSAGAVRILVEDEGPGVPAADRPRVWDAFHRGSNAVGTVAVGSGIGLSVVRDIVTAHGGTVSIENAETGGARFIVELPALTAVSPNDSTSIEKVS